MKKTELKKVDTLMSQYAVLNQQRQDLLDTIMPDLKVIEEGMKAKQLKLKEIGEANKESFDEKGNLHLSDGYLHIARSTNVLVGKKFDLSVFAKEKPHMIDIAMKTKPIKDAFLDKDMRKELKALGVDVTTTETVEVKLTKK
jgi:hypothetical protein